jgi:hypothetical protein
LAQCSEELKKFLQSPTNWRQRCRGTSLGGRSGSRYAAPLDPIDWNGTATFLRCFRFDGRRIALSWQLPKPLTSSSKAGPAGPYAKRFLRAFECLDVGDGLTFAEQSCRPSHHVEFGYTHVVPCERIPQKFGHEDFGATTRHVYSHLSRIEGSPLLARLRSSTGGQPRLRSAALNFAALVKGRFAQRGPLRAGTFCRWCRPLLQRKWMTARRKPL